jgi:hypothetical protein
MLVLRDISDDLAKLVDATLSTLTVGLDYRF